MDALFTNLRMGNPAGIIRIPDKISCRRQAAHLVMWGNTVQKDLPSPLITHLSWGKMTVEGIGPGKDFKLWPGGGRPWDWNETNTHHYPGIQPADIEELLEHGAEEIVLSRGMLLALHICPETIELLDAEGIKKHIIETKAAGEIYNQLNKDGKVVGGLFHSTC